MSGKRLAPKAVRIGYFSQDQLDELTAGDTLLQHVMRALLKDTPPPKQRSVAAQMGFSHEKVETKVEALSGGEKVRLILGLIALEKPHILILDEPTSHLDIDSREALIYAINDFPGAVLLITHDVYLAEATADALWLVKDGKVSPYDGDLNDYRTLVLSTDREKASPAKAAAASDEGGDKAEARRKASAAREAAAPLKKKAQDAEKTMERLAAKIAALDVEVARPDIQPHEVRQRLKERAKFVAEREAAEATWLEASEAYEAAVR
jgi:ATP-binding cassette subfamily F protein 3